MARLGALVLLSPTPNSRRDEYLLREDVLGLSVLERIILNLKECGIKKMVILGDRDSELKEFIRFSRRARDLDIFFIGDGERLGSILELLEKLPERLLILVGPYFLVEGYLSKIVDGKEHEKTLFLVLKRDELRGNGEVKVSLRDSRIIDIGYDLANPDGVLVGLIVSKNALLNITNGLEESVSLIEFLKNIIRLKDQKVIFVDEEKVVHVDSEEKLKLLEKKLLRSLNKPDDGFISYYLNRRISTRLSKYLVRTPLTPNMISIISFSLALLAAYLFSLGSYLYTVIAGIITQIASIIDGCDGEVARLKGLKSKYGAVFDTILDRYADMLLAIGIAYGYYTIVKDPLILLLLAIPLTGFIMSSYARKEYIIRYQRQPSRKILLLIRRDLRLFSIFLGALFGLKYAYYIMISLGIFYHIVVVWHYLISLRKEGY